MNHPADDLPMPSPVSRGPCRNSCSGLGSLYAAGTLRDERRKAWDAAISQAWQPIDTAPKDRDIWVCGLAKTWVDSADFEWQGQAGWDADDGQWWTTSHNDEGLPLIVKARWWMELPAIPAEASREIDAAIAAEAAARAALAGAHKQ